MDELETQDQFLEDMTQGLYLSSVSRDFNTGNIAVYWWENGRACGGMISEETQRTLIRLLGRSDESANARAYIQRLYNLRQRLGMKPWVCARHKYRGPLPCPTTPCRGDLLAGQGEVVVDDTTTYRLRYALIRCGDSQIGNICFWQRQGDSYELTVADEFGRLGTP